MNESVFRYFLRTCGVLTLGGVYALRLTAFAVLSVLEPVVAIVLSLLAVLGFGTCFLYRFVVHAPHFPFALMLTLSLAASVLLVAYQLAMRALTP
jgi:hypothetical protein